jgi:prefoldin subunit 5
MSEERFDAIDARLERISATCERTADNIEMLAQQIGVLTEGISDMHLTSERQKRNIDQLVGIVEVLIARQS